MSAGTALLLSVFAASLVYAAVELGLTRRFRGPAFWQGMRLREVTLDLPRGLEAAGSAVASCAYGSTLVTEGAVLLRTGPLGLLANPVVIVGRVAARSTTCELRLAFGAPVSLVLGAVLLGHLAGKTNPFFREPATPEFLLLAAGAVGVLVLVAVLIAAARRRAHLLLETLPSLYAREALGFTG